MHLAISIFYNAYFILSVVDISHFLCLFMCPLSVAGHDSGRYFWTASVVRPGHIADGLFFIALVSTLSMILYTVLSPLFARYSMFCLKHSTNVSAFDYFIGVDRMALDVQSYMMNIAVIPCIDVIGNFPVNYAYIVPSFLSTYPNVINIWFIISFSSCGFMHRAVSICSNASFILSVVDLMPFLCLFMCPLSVVGNDSGKYFWTASVVRPGRVAN